MSPRWREHAGEFVAGMAEGYVLARRRLWPLYIVVVALIVMGALGPGACSRCERPPSGRSA